MRLCRISIIVVLMVLATSVAFAASPERALENPIWLSETGDAPFAYLSYSPNIEQFLVAYTEYDAYAEGYGGFVVRYGGEEDETILTAVVATERDDLDLGAAIHWVIGPESTWLLDLGAAYRVGMVELHVGIHDIPFTKWKEITERWHFSAGASLDLTEVISVGIDTRFLEEPAYKGYILLSLRPDFKTQLYALYKDSDWEAIGVDAWLSRGSFVFRVGYRMDWDNESHFCVGIGRRL